MCRLFAVWVSGSDPPSVAVRQVSNHEHIRRPCHDNSADIWPTTRLVHHCQFEIFSLWSNSTNSTHTHPFNDPFSGTIRVSQYQKGKTNLDFTEARDSEWQWHQLGHMQVCTSLQTDNYASIPPLSFLQAGCPSCCPTNSVKGLK